MRNIVVIGTSAGGVQALIALFEHLPADLPAWTSTLSAQRQNLPPSSPKRWEAQ
ncbi:chemotaxis protein CheB [Pseudomonas sp. NPDC099000]|uniref:chemotaxis protein CheB n=1 Tax=Pseudomonas sp. NPDC099000 TaxID=3364488 RepID=UPI00383A52F2